MEEMEVTTHVIVHLYEFETDVENRTKINILRNFYNNKESYEDWMKVMSCVFGWKAPESEGGE